MSIQEALNVSLIFAQVQVFEIFKIDFLDTTPLTAFPVFAPNHEDFVFHYPYPRSHYGDNFNTMEFDFMSPLIPAETTFLVTDGEDQIKVSVRAFRAKNKPALEYRGLDQRHYSAFETPTQYQLRFVCVTKFCSKRFWVIKMKIKGKMISMDEGHSDFTEGAETTAHHISPHMGGLHISPHLGGEFSQLVDMKPIFDCYGCTFKLELRSFRILRIYS